MTSINSFYFGRSITSIQNVDEKCKFVSDHPRESKIPKVTLVPNQHIHVDHPRAITFIYLLSLMSILTRVPLKSRCICVADNFSDGLNSSASLRTEAIYDD